MYYLFLKRKKSEAAITLYFLPAGPGGGVTDRGGALVDPIGGKAFIPDKFPAFVAPEPGCRLFADGGFKQVPVPECELAFRQAAGVVSDLGKVGAVAAPAAFVDPGEDRRDVSDAGAPFRSPDKGGRVTKEV